MSQIIPFRKGERIRIYQKPISQEDFEDEATLVKVEQTHKDFDWPGLHVERWWVRFDDEATLYPRTIALPLEGSDYRARRQKLKGSSLEASR